MMRYKPTYFPTLHSLQQVSAHVAMRVAHIKRCFHGHGEHRVCCAGLSVAVDPVRDFLHTVLLQVPNHGHRAKVSVFVHVLIWVQPDISTV